MSDLGGTYRISSIKLLCQVHFVMVRARLHLATATQIFDAGSMSSEMGCIFTNVTVRT